MKADWMYNGRQDILTLLIKGRRSAYSLASSDGIFTADLDGKNRICALEVFDASKVIAGMTKKALRGIVSAEIRSQLKGNYFVVGFRLVSASKQQVEDSVPIPIEG